MGKINLKGAQDIDSKKINQLERHIDYLLSNIYGGKRKRMAAKMGKHPANFGKILNGRQRVSHAFIEEFYRIFGPELPDESELNEDSGEYGQTQGAHRPTLADVMAILQRIESKIDRQAGLPEKEN